MSAASCSADNYSVEYVDQAFSDSPTIYGPVGPDGTVFAFALLSAEAADDGDPQVQVFSVSEGTACAEYVYVERVGAAGWWDAMDRALGFVYGMSRPVRADIEAMLRGAGVLA